MSKPKSKNRPAIPTAPTTSASHQGGDLQVGDHVTVGSGEVHWIIDRISPAAHQHPIQPFVRLVSGMTGRHRVACLSELRLHSRGES